MMYIKFLADKSMHASRPSDGHAPCPVIDSTNLDLYLCFVLLESRSGPWLSWFRFVDFIKSLN
jgi:hypothetical protein